MLVEHPLYKEILNSPDDDDARLVFADWLEDCGENPLSEFIRIQVELATIPDDSEGVANVRKAELRKQEQQLMALHVRRWNGNIHRFLAKTELKHQVSTRRAPVRRWEWHRGFIDFLDLEARTLNDHWNVLRQIGPVQRLRLRDLDSCALAIKDSPALRQMRHLDLTRFLNSESIAVLLNSSNLLELRSIDFGYNSIAGAITDILLEATTLPKLEHLRLCNLTNERLKFSALQQRYRLSLQQGPMGVFIGDSLDPQLALVTRQGRPESNLSYVLDLFQRLFWPAK